MCELKPGPRCAADTRAKAATATMTYQSTYPNGPEVDPLSNGTASALDEIDLSSQPLAEEHSAAGTGTLFENQYLSVSTVPSRYGPYTVVQSGTGSGAAILAVREEKILMVSQPRYATGTHQWELPRGGARPDEDLPTSAIRETRDETGQEVDAEDLWALGSVNPDTGILNTEVGLFLADLDATAQDQPRADGHEVDQAAWVPKEKVVQACVDGTITDAFTCVAVLRARLRGLI